MACLIIYSTEYIRVKAYIGGPRFPAHRGVARLVAAAREPCVVREELSSAKKTRGRKGASLCAPPVGFATLGQMDFHRIFALDFSSDCIYKHVMPPSRTSTS